MSPLSVELVYAIPARQLILKMQVAPGTTVEQLIAASAIRAEFPEIEARPSVGIFSKKVRLDHVLSAGERVEIYRPLIADPKDARRQKVEQERATKKKQQAL